MSTTEFAVRDYVVYPAHGVGKIVAIETQTIAGTEIQVYVIDFIREKMVLRVPVKRAALAGLRHLSTKILIDKAFSILRGRPKMSRGMWSRRAQEYETKINSGDILLIAEVVRDLHKNVDDPDRSYSERVIYEAALGRLSGECAAVEGVEPKEAVDRLVDLLRDKRAA
jgi:CarD family transcriptional regulator